MIQLTMTQGPELIYQIDSKGMTVSISNSPRIRVSVERTDELEEDAERGRLLLAIADITAPSDSAVMDENDDD